MDTKWLITIVIGNVIAAIVKESAGAIIRRMPKIAATLIGKLKPTVISILSRHWRIAVDLVFIVFTMVALILMVRSKEPMTRGDVFAISVMTYYFLHWQMQLTLDLKRSGHFDAIHDKNAA